MTLDLSTHSSLHASIRKKSKHNAKNAVQVNGGVASPRANGEVAEVPTEAPTEAPIEGLDIDETPEETATTEEEAQPESLERLQILDFHGENPLVSYQGMLFSCQWSKPLGTDVLLKVPSTPQVQIDLQNDPVEISPILSWSDLRLMAKPVSMVPHSDIDVVDDNAPMDGACVAGTINPSSRQEILTGSAPISQPQAHSQDLHASSRKSDILPDADEPDQQWTLQDPQSGKSLKPLDALVTQGHVLGSEDQPRDLQMIQPTQQTSEPQLKPFTEQSAPSTAWSQDLTTQTAGAPSVNEEATDTGPTSEVPSPRLRGQSLAGPLTTAMPTFSKSAAGAPPTIPVSEHSSVPRKNQASFLSRMIAAKRARGEIDAVTIYAKKNNTGTAWRAQQQDDLDREAEDASLTNDGLDIDGNRPREDIHEAYVPTRKRVGFTDNGVKIGRPRTEVFAGGRGQANESPRWSDASQGIRGVNPLIELQREQRSLDRDVEMIENRNLGATEDVIDPAL